MSEPAYPRVLSEPDDRVFRLIEPQEIGPDEITLDLYGEVYLPTIPDDVTPREVAMLSLFNACVVSGRLASMERFGIQRLFRRKDAAINSTAGTE